VKASQEERNHLRKQLERMQEKQQADANLKVEMMMMVVVVVVIVAAVALTATHGVARAYG
jgi:hypothetical protein